MLGLAVGAALGLVGALMQGLTRNPLADPGILGINAGAAFAMVLAISAFGFSDLRGYVWFAFAGAAIAMVLVHVVASVGRDGTTPIKVAIAGAAVTAALSSWTQGRAAQRPQDDRVLPALAGRDDRRPGERRTPDRAPVPRRSARSSAWARCAA